MQRTLSSRVRGAKMKVSANCAFLASTLYSSGDRVPHISEQDRRWPNRTVRRSVIGWCLAIVSQYVPLTPAKSGQIWWRPRSWSLTYDCRFSAEPINYSFAMKKSALSVGAALLRSELRVSLLRCRWIGWYSRWGHQSAAIILHFPQKSTQFSPKELINPIFTWEKQHICG